jgi:8-oxo-dGTP diphosphatase
MPSSLTPPRGNLVSVAWLCVRQGRLLVVRTKGSDVFFMPGGKPERRESLTQALRREIGEELGLEIDAQTIREAFVERSTAYGLAGVNLQMHCFTGNAVGEPRPDREIAELSWVVPNDRHCCAPAVQQVLDRLFSIRGMPIGRLLRLG